MRDHSDVVLCFWRGARVAFSIVKFSENDFLLNRFYCKVMIA